VDAYSLYTVAGYRAAFGFALALQALAFVWMMFGFIGKNRMAA